MAGRAERERRGNEIRAVLERVVARHEEWRAIRERPRLPFRWFLARNDRSAFMMLLRQLVLCASLPRDVQRSLRPPRGRRLGPSVLQKYMPFITERYFQIASNRRFEDFLREITYKCFTEEELQRFLGKSDGRVPLPPRPVR